MPSRNIDDAAGAKEVHRSTRNSLIGPKSKRIALNSRNRSLAAAEKKTQSQLSFPPKSEYEKFYETVFLAEDLQPEEVSPSPHMCCWGSYPVLPSTATHQIVLFTYPTWVAIDLFTFT